jgi:hypothetical protein
MRYLTPDFIEAYKSAEKDGRKKMLRSILDAWDSEYQGLISRGVSPDIIWYYGIRQISKIIAADGADGYNQAY